MDEVYFERMKGELESGMGSASPGVVVSRDGQDIGFNDVLKMLGRGLLHPNLNVTIDGYEVCFWEGRLFSYSSSRNDKKGIGIHYRYVGTCASKETDKESAIELICSALGTANCFNSDETVNVYPRKVVNVN